MFKKQDLNLIKEITLSEFKLKYKSSVLGFFWSLLKPLAMLTTLYIVFRIFIKVDSENYSLFLLLGIILWNFFSESTVLGLNSIVSKSDIVKKLNFRSEVLVISACLVSLLSFTLNFIMFLIFFLFIKGLPSLSNILIIIPILQLFLLSLGLSFILATVFVKFRDLGYLWEVLLQIGFWISPIAYPPSIVPVKYMGLYILNPLSRIITSSREIILNNQLPTFTITILSTMIIILILFLGYFIFRLNHKRFVEYL